MNIGAFHLPRSRQIPDVGLYLDQTVKYVNHALAPLGCPEVTGSMVSNYVKKGYIKNPIKKQYGAEQIAYLFLYALVKQILPMEYIARLDQLQHEQYAFWDVYDAFCEDLEAQLCRAFGLPVTEAVPRMQGKSQSLMHSVNCALTNVIYLNASMETLFTDTDVPAKSTEKRKKDRE